MSEISSKGIAYTDSGHGEHVLLFIHGIMMSRAVWQEQVAYFSTKYRVLAVDLYGFGESTGEFRDSSFEDHALNLFELLQELGISKTTLIGWSMGGSISLVFAHLYLDFVQRMVIVDSTPQLLLSEDFPHAIPPGAAADLMQALESDPHAGASAFVGMQIVEEHCEQQRDLLLSVVMKTDWRTALATFRSSSQRDLRDILHGIRAPTCIVCGELDAVCPSGASQYMKENIQHSELFIMPGLGHAPFLTSPSAFNSIVASFLES